ncbi:MAG: phosphoribosylamine--glycine ligase [Streptosporangiales bacterium]|nr:phosphoribosylamine--glycine ligase [Streptosporangiales bacterium]
MKVLVLGGGGREHALCRALADDREVTDLACAPGNAGTAGVATNHPVSVTDGAAVVELVGNLAADLVVVGPEAPLVAGVADEVRAAGVPCFGPSAAAAHLEGSKAFAKEIMAAAGVPTAESRVCAAKEEVTEALDAFGPPYVVKNDGLAGGKGVVVTEDRSTAESHAAACGRVVVEEYLDGPELSLFALTDGTTVLPLQPAQDYKRIHDGDHGPNTGGMGAYSPLPWAPPTLVEDVAGAVLQPTVDEMRRRGRPYAGLLYAGLALTSGGPKVVEFNARFGDPETQPLLARLRTPLAPLLHATATGELAAAPPPRWSAAAAVTVVIAAEGYPGAVATGDVIDGVEEAEGVLGAYVLHAGTARDEAGRLVSAGGRVLNIVGVGADLAEARTNAYDGAARIRMRGAQYRTDIAAPRSRLWGYEWVQIRPTT